ncbi:ABC transporter ATP-binding protein [Clostridia bacterium]|nr:ABC transporter ATP-binding protein [Clostridia bacterium]
MLRIENLSKSFGNHRVLEGISFTVPEGSIFGFIGANGAGKTTTMKLILGLLTPDSGDIYVCGEKVSFGSSKTNRNVGFLPDVPEYYNYMRPREYLRLCGEITGMPSAKIKSRSDELLRLVGLTTNKKIGGFSRGMKQRLGVAQALLNEPKLLICDEPTSALDPVGRKEILDILLEIKRKTTVIFSTHILSDVERICDSAAVLNKGKIVLNGSLAELKARHGKADTAINFASPADRETFMNLPDVHTHYALSEQGESGVTVSAESIESLLMEAFT